MEKQTIEPPVRLEDDGQIAAAIESLLFVSGRPLTRAELRKLLDIDEEHLGAGLRALGQALEQEQRGVRVQYLGEQVQLVTAPEYARYVAALLGLPMTAKLTTAALETLSVVAYRQPVTRSQIEAVRGVNSDRALTSLIQHGLVEEIGRAPTVGRPSLFATTADFMQQFGLTSMEQLPHPNTQLQSALEFSRGGGFAPPASAQPPDNMGGDSAPPAPASPFSRGGGFAPPEHETYE